ncbi:hypothetical protein RhiirA5_413432 [Rhizophagus irregularis]|uniref:Uncharacterized protein n=1 Tax=Rhizophagus irregularis TaxID=588596 RepID=A0A2N0SL32_9GLOM|nr:hypothetical protein RhiirA5_413432 [Rhizophagus irregularis]PKC76248.1 hypothetical protein RhiirA1_447792 [Rhizophagus irregularis]
MALSNDKVSGNIEFEGSSSVEFEGSGSEEFKEFKGSGSEEFEESSIKESKGRSLPN